MRTETHTHTVFGGYFRRRLPVLLAAGVALFAVSAPSAFAADAGTDAPLSFWERALQALSGGGDGTQLPLLAGDAKPAAPTAAAPAEQAPASPAPAAPKNDGGNANEKSGQLRWITGSRYVQSLDKDSMQAMGCRAGTRGQNGLVVLAFGKPYYNGHSYGTISFSNTFASNAAITAATKNYAKGYVSCLAKDSPAIITLARGTSNYDPAVPSTEKAGRKWARETMVFAKWLREHPEIAGHVKAAAAIDAEPAWDPSFRKTHGFFKGYRAAATGYLLYNFGSLDGGVGSIWNLQQAFYVSGGMKDARVVPEIYFKAQAQQWAELARLAQERYGRPVQFAGVMTQYASGCPDCGYRPLQGHRALKRELASDEATAELAESLDSLTNIN